jgi:hypothetical protein
MVELAQLFPPGVQPYPPARSTLRCPRVMVRTSTNRHVTSAPSLSTIRKYSELENN